MCRLMIDRSVENDPRHSQKKSQPVAETPQLTILPPQSIIKPTLDVQIDDSANHGRWTPEEHHLFLEAINQFGREWDKVQAVVKTRSLAQIRSHAQKYFLKLSKNEEMERLNEYDLWHTPLNREHANALLVLDFMGTVLKKLKNKREEILEKNGYSSASPYHESSPHTETSTSYDRLDELEELHALKKRKFHNDEETSENNQNKLTILQRAIEQLDQKSYHEFEMIHDNAKTDQESLS